MCEAKRAHIRQLQQSDETLPQDPCTSWADVEHLRDKVFSMQSAVESKREELRSLAEVLEEKVQTAAEFQDAVAEAEKEVGHLVGAPRPWQRSPEALSTLEGTGPGPSSHLEAKIQATCAQLASAQQALGHMVRSHVQNDQLVRGMVNSTGSVTGTPLQDEILDKTRSVKTEPHPSHGTPQIPVSGNRSEDG